MPATGAFGAGRICSDLTQQSRGRQGPFRDPEQALRHGRVLQQNEDVTTNDWRPPEVQPDGA